MKSLLLWFGLFVLFAFQLPADEMRGIWVDAFGPGFLNKQQVQQLGETCRKYNFNAVFVQVRKRGDAYYFPHKPNDEPRAPELAPDFDPLAEIIKECHGKEPRIEVHAWVVGCFVWAFDKPPREKNHVFNRHKDWLTKDSIGQTIVGQGYFLDLGHPDAAAYLLNVAKDIVTHYDVDGLHWDYLRYPHQDSGYNEVALKRFKEEFTLEKNPLPDDAKFLDWRRRQVTDFVRWSTAEMLAIKPKLAVSASVFSNYKDSREHRLTDWVEWNKEGILDIAMPMNFTADNKFVFNPRSDFAATNHGLRAIYMGQGGYKTSKENTLTQLNYWKSLQAKAQPDKPQGMVFYSYRNPTDEDVSGKRKKKSLGVEIIVDDKDAVRIGDWSKGGFDKAFGEGYCYHTKGIGSNVVKFAAKLPQAGQYEVYEWHPAGLNRAENAPFTVLHARGTNRVTINQKLNGARWNLLGTFPFQADAEVRVSDEDLKGNVVIADAVKLVLVSTNDMNGDEPIVVQDEAGNTQWEQIKAKQEEVFTFLQSRFQPTWENVPALPWKTNQAILKGIVTGKDGKPVYNALVTLNSTLPRMQKTDVHGTFAFFALMPGSYELKSATDEKEQSQQVTIASGQVVTRSLVRDL